MDSNGYGYIGLGASGQIFGWDAAPGTSPGLIRGGDAGYMQEVDYLAVGGPHVYFAETDFSQTSHPSTIYDLDGSMIDKFNEHATGLAANSSAAYVTVGAAARRYPDGSLMFAPTTTLGPIAAAESCVYVAVNGDAGWSIIALPK
jgi:hypothetical protein